MDSPLVDAHLHTVVEPSPSQAAIGRVLEILERAIVAPVPVPPGEFSPRWTAFLRLVNRQQRTLMWAGAAFMLMSIVFFFLESYLGREGLLAAALITALLAEACGILHVGSDIVSGVPFLQGMLRRPHDSFLKMLRTTTAVDLPYLRELGTCELAAVQLVHRHCQFHRMTLERRGGALSGSIDKIGLFPAVAALALLWISFSAVAAPFALGLQMLVPMIFAFHLLNLFSLGLQVRQDRMIALLESSIATRKK